MARLPQPCIQLPAAGLGFARGQTETKTTQVQDGQALAG
jgi:hypothetical protein